MIGDELDSGQHIVRYVNAHSVLEDGTAEGEAFELRLGEDCLSVNWLEIFGQEKEDQLSGVRSSCRFGRRSSPKRRSRDRFAEINVGELMRTLSGEIESSRVLHDPLEASGEFDADPSHAIVTDMPLHGTRRAKIIGELIAECVAALHPAAEPQDD